MISYGRLLEIAQKMHGWIFLNVGDEYEVYDQLGLSDEENVELGSLGSFELVETAGKGNNNLSDVNVVHCTECQYYYTPSLCQHKHGLMLAGDDCFCSYGLKKK